MLEDIIIATGCATGCFSFVLILIRIHQVNWMFTKLSKRIDAIEERCKDEK
jgi:hypothetical protein